MTYLSVWHHLLPGPYLNHSDNNPEGFFELFSLALHFPFSGPSVTKSHENLSGGIENRAKSLKTDTSIINSAIILPDASYLVINDRPGVNSFPDS